MALDPDPAFASWAIVEVMGHGRFAGFVTVETIGGPMIRVDVPAVDDAPAFTKYLAPGSLFAITPTDEQTARRAAAAFRSRPIDVYELRPVAAIGHDPDDDDDDGDGENYGGVF